MISLLFLNVIHNITSKIQQILIPAEARKLKIKGNLKTPVYVTQNRKNAVAVGQVFVTDLKTPERPSHWIIQGVALVLNVDY